MQAPDPHPREAERLAALRGLGLLDTPPEPRFDALTRTACRMFGVRTALIGLVDQDRAWFKSRVGFEASEVPRDLSFCTHTILGEGALVVEDATRDPRFSTNPLVTGEFGLRFYAGEPLRTADGLPLGTLCLIDDAPRIFTEHERQALQDLALLAETEIQARGLARADADRLHTLLGTMSEGMVIQNAEGVIVASNPAACLILGLSQSQLEGRSSIDPSWRTVHEDGSPWPGSDHPAMRVLQTRQPQLGQIMGVHTPDGRLRWIYINSLPLQDGGAGLQGTATTFLDITDLKEQTRERDSREEALRGSEQRYRNMAENVPGVIYQFQVWPDGRTAFPYISPRVERTYGITPEQWRAQPTFALDSILAEDQPSYLDAYMDAVARMGTFQWEGRSRTARPGEIIWIRAQSQPVPQSDGSILWDGVITDVTVLKQQEAQLAQDFEAIKAREHALVESESRFRLLAERTTDVIARHGPDATIQFITPAVSQILGYTPEELLGQLPTAFVLEDDIPLMRQAYTSILQGHRLDTFRYRARHKDGTLVWLESAGNAVMDPATGALVETIITSRDITQRVRDEEALRASEARSRALIEALPDLIFVVDREGTQLEVYAKEGHTLRRPVQEMLGANLRDFLPPDLVTERLARIRRVLDSGQMEIYEAQVGEGEGRQDHETRVVACGANRVMLIVRDITERKALDRLKGEFVSTVSHELRTPLTAIRGALGLLLGGVAGELSPQVAELLALGQHNVERLVRLINDLLDLEKLDKGQMPFAQAAIDLGTLMEATARNLQPMADHAGVTLILDSVPEPVVVMADPDRLTQVLVNLLSNALKYSPQPGQVTLRLKTLARSARMEVEDHGPGIPEGFRVRLFQRFAQADGSDTREKGGTGLGLSISKGFVERMGGQLSYESSPGHTRFWVDLPLAAQGKGAGTK